VLFCKVRVISLGWIAAATLLGEVERTIQNGRYGYRCMAGCASLELIPPLRHKQNFGGGLVCSRSTEFMMSIWPQDLTKNTLEEVVSFHAENMRTSKHVGFRTKTIIERKLAGKINREEYLAERKLGTEDAAECVRRRTLLLAELGRRENFATRQPEPTGRSASHSSPLARR
jgi:hypothetical protein